MSRQQITQAPLPSHVLNNFPENKFKEFVRLLTKSSDENGTRNAYRVMMGIKEWDAPFNCDGYYNGVLYEFKHGKRLAGQDKNKALAQACYYLRRFVLEGMWVKKTGQTAMVDPPIKVVIADNKSACFIMSDELSAFYLSDEYDWKRSASTPDEKLVSALKVIRPIIYDVLDIDGFLGYLAALEAIGTTIYKVITRHNFASIFQVWKNEFAADLDPQRSALAFLLDLEKKGTVNEDTGAVLFDFEGETKNVKLRVPVSVYRHFWAVYKRPPHHKELSAIFERKDTLIAMQNRRMDGEFFTPLVYATLAHEYLGNAIPNQYEVGTPHHSMYDDYNWWDMCCGTGNLTYDCPPNMKGELFMSTLNQEDVDVCNGSGQNPNAHIFTYDFLNAPDEELPVELRAKLTPGSKWVFVLNPPFAAGTSPDGKSSKANVSNTKESNFMEEDKMAHACQNLTSQFLHRIWRLQNIYKIDVSIGLFSPAIFLTGNGYSVFRDRWTSSFTYDSGFCFPADEFNGVNGNWPILFTTWVLNKSNINNKAIVDVMVHSEKIGQKQFSSADKPLNKWIDRPKNGKIIFPPLTNAISIATDNSIRLDTLSFGAIGYMSSVANDIKNSNVSFFLSAPAAHAHGWVITPSIFEQSIISCAARKLVSPQWLNNKDEYSVPNTEYSEYPEYEQFSKDVVVWALFNGCNQSSSLGGIEYKGNTYDITNHFFWLTPYEVENIENIPMSISADARRSEPRFVSTWSQDKTFSPDVQELIQSGKKLVEVSAWARPHAEPKYQLHRWDAGWYQIRMGLFGKEVKFQKTPEMVEAMQEFEVKYKAITERLRPYVYTLGFLPQEILYS